MAALYARHKIKTVKYDCDIKLLFETYLNIVYKKASLTLHALARVSNHISQRKLRIIIKAFITSQSGYCSFRIDFPQQKVK